MNVYRACQRQGRIRWLRQSLRRPATVREMELMKNSFELFRQSAGVAALMMALSGPTVDAMNGTQGGALPGPLPLFPADNWWNLDISAWPVDANSASYIIFINNGGARHLHPDFGGNAPGPQDHYACYGMPYAVVSSVANA